MMAKITPPRDDGYTENNNNVAAIGGGGGGGGGAPVVQTPRGGGFVFAEPPRQIRYPDRRPSSSRRRVTTSIAGRASCVRHKAMTRRIRVSDRATRQSANRRRESKTTSVTTGDRAAFAPR